MNCDYPCHICDPEAYEESLKPTWEGIEKDVARDFENQSRWIDWAEKPRSISAPIWWELMGDIPADIQIDQHRDTEDIYSDGTFGIPRGYIQTILTNVRTYLSVDGGRWQVTSYAFSEDPKRLWVLAKEPPGFGEWLPTLKDFS